MTEEQNQPSLPPMPPEELLVGLPEKGIPATTSVTTPLVMLPDDSVPVVMAATNLGLPAKLIAEETNDPVRFINTLLEAGETTAVLNFLAWSLPKRVGLWWAFECCWTTILDRDRLLARQGPTDDGAKAPKSGASPPPHPTETKAFKDAMAKTIAQAEAASAQASQAIPELQTRLTEMVERLSLKYATPSTPGVASAVEQSARRARSTRLKIQEALVRSKAGQRQPKPLRIKHPESGSPGDPKKSAAPRSHHPLHARANDRRREGRLRGMASCLQWILNPCQENAIAAYEALPSIHDSPSVSSLTKATFWCGENLSVDPQKPQVPPPPSLPRKGITDAITKTGSIKHTSWSRTDKTNWYLVLGLRIAAGTHPWNHAGERFDRYMTWALDEVPKGSH